MKNASSLVLLLPLLFASCQFDEAGDPSIAPWFWCVLGSAALMIVLLGVSGTKDVKHVEDHLKTKGLKPTNFKKCGNYVGGHPSLDKPIVGTAILRSDDVLKIYEFPFSTKVPKYMAADIPIAAIKNIQVEDASSLDKKVTLGRVLLVGVFALAWKKKKKNELAFVTIEWKDRFEHQTVFSFEGKLAMQSANTARNSIISILKD
jgi:hypothetical protein